MSKDAQIVAVIWLVFIFLTATGIIDSPPPCETKFCN